MAVRGRIILALAFLKCFGVGVNRSGSYAPSIIIFAVDVRDMVVDIGDKAAHIMQLAFLDSLQAGARAALEMP